MREFRTQQGKVEGTAMPTKDVLENVVIELLVIGVVGFVLLILRRSVITFARSVGQRAIRSIVAPRTTPLRTGELGPAIPKNLDPWEVNLRFRGRRAQHSVDVNATGNVNGRLPTLPRKAGRVALFPSAPIGVGARGGNPWAKHSEPPQDEPTGEGRKPPALVREWGP
jgi:hypothetical protein